MDRMLSDKRIIAILVLPALLIFGAMFVLPTITTIVYSFCSWQGIGELKFIGLENYKNLLTKDPVFWIGVKNTLIILVFSLVIQVPCGLILALLLDKQTRGLKFYKAVYFIPVVISTVAVSLLWRKIYDPNFGIIANVFQFLGMKDNVPEFLNNPDTVIYAVTVPIIWQYIGYHMVILYAGIKSIPKTYYEAAMIDGASGIRALTHVTIPLLRDVLKVCIVLATVGSLKMFDSIYIMTQGGPFNSSSTVALQMYNEAFLKMNFGYGSSIAIMLVIECLVFSFVLNKYLTGEQIEF